MTTKGIIMIVKEAWIKNLKLKFLLLKEILWDIPIIDKKKPENIEGIEKKKESNLSAILL